GARPVLRPGHQAPARAGRGLPRHRRAGPRQGGQRPRREHARQGPQARGRGPAVSLPPRPGLLRRRPRPLPEAARRPPEDKSQPARVKLCQDLLRLGREEEGRKMAAEVFGKDAYTVLAYNLVTPRDRLAAIRTLHADGLVVRMDPREADL